MLWLSFIELVWSTLKLRDSSGLRCWLWCVGFSIIVLWAHATGSAGLEWGSQNWQWRKTAFFSSSFLLWVTTRLPKNYAKSGRQLLESANFVSQFGCHEAEGEAASHWLVTFVSSWFCKCLSKMGLAEMGVGEEIDLYAKIWSTVGVVHQICH